MRQDMWKVIIDLPRGGSFLPNHKTRLRLKGGKADCFSDEDNFGSQDFGSRRRRQSSYNTKESSDRLQPLWRFLHSRVGKLWNSVHSEIASTLDSRSLVRGRHFWSHVLSAVKVNCSAGTDGKIYCYERGGGRFEVTGFYVDPVSGKLCYQHKPRQRYDKVGRFMDRLASYGFKEFEKFFRGNTESWRNFRILDELTVLEKKPGGWFVHKFARHQPDDIVDWTTPKYLGGPRLPIYFKDKKNHSPLYRVSTRQLGKKDLKALKVIIAGSPLAAGF